MKLRAWSFAAALALTALALPTQGASAAAAPSCPDGSVCFYSGEGFGGRIDGVGPGAC